jgi:hypothetical protein
MAVVLLKRDMMGGLKTDFRGAFLTFTVPKTACGLSSCVLPGNEQSFSLGCLLRGILFTFGFPVFNRDQRLPLKIIERNGSPLRGRSIP